MSLFFGLMVLFFGVMASMFLALLAVDVFFEWGNKCFLLVLTSAIGSTVIAFLTFKVSILMIEPVYVKTVMIFGWLVILILSYLNYSSSIKNRRQQDDIE